MVHLDVCESAVCWMRLTENSTIDFDRQTECLENVLMHGSCSNINAMVCLQRGERQVYS